MRIYIASGDFLTRNTERRVEVGVRVDDPAIAKKLRGILDLQLRDTVNAREMQPDGTYVKVHPADGQPRWTVRWRCLAISRTASRRRRTSPRNQKQNPSPRRQP